MATARKLPSGSWRVRVVDHYENVGGKRKIVYRSFTSDDPSRSGKAAAERMAADWLCNRDKYAASDLTFGTALDFYIQSKENVLSPTTVSNYRMHERLYYDSLKKTRLDQITQADIQGWVNLFAVDHSPKTCYNAHGLLAAVLAQYRPDFVLRTKLPQKKRPEYYTPTDEDIRRLLESVGNDELRKAILLSAFGTLRRGEVCGLMDTDIDGDVITVRRTMYKANPGYKIKDYPKTPESQRQILYPHFVIQEFEGVTGFLVKMKPNKITQNFRHAVRSAGLPDFRFHDLRAYSVSIAHAMGIPDAYLMERGGWKTDSTLKSIYRRTMSDKSREFADQLNHHYSDIFTAC